MNIFCLVFLFTALINQATLDNPMSWDFAVVDYNQTMMYKLLGQYWNMGKSAIIFPASNSSANYSSIDWMKPCYERFYEIGGKFIIYWLVNGDMYCEVIVRGSDDNYKASFAQNQLFRAEYKKTWCPAPS